MIFFSFIVLPALSLVYASEIATISCNALSRTVLDDIIFEKYEAFKVDKRDEAFDMIEFCNLIREHLAVPSYNSMIDYGALIALASHQECHQLVKILAEGRYDMDMGELMLIMPYAHPSTIKAVLELFDFREEIEGEEMEAVQVVFKIPELIHAGNALEILDWFTEAGFSLEVFKGGIMPMTISLGYNRLILHFLTRNIAVRLSYMYNCKSMTMQEIALHHGQWDTLHLINAFFTFTRNWPFLVEILSLWAPTELTMLIASKWLLNVKL